MTISGNDQTLGTLYGWYFRGKIKATHGLDSGSMALSETNKIIFIFIYSLTSSVNIIF